MEEWKEYKISEIGTVVGGATPSTKDPHNYDGNIAWITPKDLSNFKGRYIEHGERMITEEGFANSSCKMLPKDSVLFSSRAPIGYVAIAKNELCTNQGFKNIIPNKKIVDSRYLYYLLVNNKTRIEELGSGTTFKEVSGRVMKNISILLPPLAIQNHIASILSSLDDKIEVNQRINDNLLYPTLLAIQKRISLLKRKNDNLEQQAQALFKSWFVDFEPFKDGEFVESELGLIPMGWRVGRLSEVANITMGTSPAGSSYNMSGEGDVFYQGRAEFGFRFPKRNMYTTGAKRFADVDSVLLSVRAPVGDINVAEERCCIGRGLASIQSKEGNNSYILYLIRNLQPQFEKFNSEGTVFGCINKRALEQLVVMIPPNETISRFDIICSEIDSQIKIHEKESRHLAILRDTLLPRLMSGKLIQNEYKYEN